MINMKSIFVIAISSICTTLAAISPQLVEIDEMYSKLLGLPNKKDEATQHSLTGICEIWKFWRNLGDEFAKTDDLKLLHFNAFKYELVQKYDDSSQKWKFSKLFDAEMMPNETNFAFQLRFCARNYG
uniref:Secreted protein n=1 Tax=Globodera pallida TaxID=36090 RepID=A0A183C883_GLOPA